MDSRVFAVIGSVLVGQVDSTLLVDVSGSRKCPVLFQDLAACSTHMPRSREVTATERPRIHSRGKYEKSSLCVPCNIIFHCSKMGTISVPSSGRLDEAVPCNVLQQTAEGQDFSSAGPHINSCVGGVWRPCVRAVGKSLPWGGLL